MKKIIYLLLLLTLMVLKTNISFASQEYDFNNLITEIDRLEKKGQILKAVDLCEKYLSSDKISEEQEYTVTSKLAILYSNYLGKEHEAIDLLTNLIDKHPKNEKRINTLYVLGSLWLESGEREKAASYYNLILAQYPNSKAASVVRSQLSMIADAKFLNSLEEGMRQYELVKGLSPLKGYSFVFFEVFKSYMLKFVIILFIIFVVYKIGTIFKFPQKTKNDVILSETDILLILAVSCFTTFFVFILFLSQYIKGGHFLIYNRYINLLISLSKEYYLILALSVTFALLFIFLYMVSKKISIKWLLFNKLKVSHNILLSILLCPIIFFILKILHYLLDKLPLERGLYSYPDSLNSVNLAYIVILAPFFEELFFRGILFSNFEQKTNFYFAAFLSALAFSLFHLDFNVSPLIFFFVFGILLSFLFKKFGLFCCILAHSIYVIGCLYFR